MENGDQPATRRDLERVEQRLDQRIERVEQRVERLEQRVEQGFEQLRAEMNHGYNDLVERITDSETRLLKAFYNFAEINNKRLSVLEGNEAAIRSRLASLEDRLMQVEKRLNMPPAA